ncbi:MAG: 2-C-methyl-D-erythritol 2,4-cyclodiphosphate synthase [Erysipelotrichaceae bacterium]|nr:2-C-methyl-D-erythritol 2,4-cyclodiphosphate synthase [Erysipelotrichaceae bacterium]
MFRIGYASDIHRLVKDRKLILGGVEIPHEFGLLGHSDADVVIHALGESILGALALGDLGTHFPDTDEKYKDIDSKILLKEIYKLMRDEGYSLENADVSISLEKPKLKNYIPQMRKILAEILNVDVSAISIKAGTNEGVGPVGRGEACVATSVVLLRKDI